MKIGVISDPHAAPEPLAEALEYFAKVGVEKTLCAGDVAGYGGNLSSTTALLQANGCLSVLGNHDRWALENDDLSSKDRIYLESLPLTLKLPLAGKTIRIVHASPPDSLTDGIRLRDENGELISSALNVCRRDLEGFPADVLIVGHTHQLLAERFGDLLLLNPGSTCFNNSCAVLHFPDLEVEFVPLGGKRLILSWNFGLERRGGR